jgi:RNA polymerase sigma-70 factor, ECF subfamily
METSPARLRAGRRGGWRPSSPRYPHVSVLTSPRLEMGEMADRAAFEGFYREHLPRVVRGCTLVLLDQAAAEDVAAEAFARLWSKWGQIESDDHAGGFVFKTAMRLCARRATRRELVGRVPEGNAPDEIGRSLDRQEVLRVLGQLPVRQRQAVVLRDWAGMPTSEVARLLGLRDSTVRVHLARGREALRTAFRVEGADHE